MAKSRPANLYERVREILASARAGVARSVNTAQVVANWLIGREIIEEEQRGNKRAGYGEMLLEELAERLKYEFGAGFSVPNLRNMRQFYTAFPSLIDAAQIRYALRSELLGAAGNSLLYERLAKSKDKRGLMRLAKKGQEVARPADVFKDPLVIEFLGLPESPRLVESDLETALLDNLQAFLLELGKGFAFVGRQQRLTLDGDHFYVDLVFYHIILKCFILIDLKVGKLTHADLGQLQLYVNYYDEHRLTAGDKPTLGLILCTDKNDAVVKYMLGREHSQKIFTSRYKLYLPSEEELRAEIEREVRRLPEARTTGPPRRKPKTR